jgi:ribonuclease P protein component
MLPSIHRLPGYRIPEILKKGTRFQSDYLTLIKEKTTGDSRFTVIVPIRLSKKANVRNRTRRLLRESIHKQLPNIQQGSDAIVMTNKLLLEEKLDDVIPIVISLLTNAGLL